MLNERTMAVINQYGGKLEGMFESYPVVYMANEMEDMYDTACAMRTDDNEELIIVGNEFKKWSKDVQLFVLWHEVGHLYNKHIMNEDDGTHEYQADAYAVAHVGKEVAYEGLNTVYSTVFEWEKGDSDKILRSVQRLTLRTAKIKECV